MPGDVGQRLLNDPVGGPAHRGRQVGPRSLDRQRRRKARAVRLLHQLRDVVEPAGRGGVVITQRLQGGAQFPGRLTSGFLDGQQGLGHLFTSPTSDVNGDLGLHLDDRDLVGERIMQLPRDVQPLLIRTAPRGLLPGALGFVRPSLGLPQRLPRGECGDQPGNLEDVAGLCQRLARRPVVEDQGSELKSDQHGHGRRHGDGSVPGPHRAVHRDQVRDGEHVKAGRLIPHRTQPGNDQDGQRSAATRGQREAAGRQQRVADHVRACAGVRLGQPGAQQQGRHTEGDRPVSDTGRDAEPSFGHARTLTGCRCGQIPLVDERDATAPAVSTRFLPHPQQASAARAAAQSACVCWTTGGAVGRHAQGTATP